ncbi:glycosyltransferase [Methylocaldum sp.]|uniref:glycosyltransferase n=1 Tax=Methylocaldum sp. TaxID=1969727 RepID=UPI002D387066|nr:glycosyltransferase [Methylocaldum sp.]HYE37380.1 glycosyltransferase [Methylocaldum sp.]
MRILHVIHSLDFGLGGPPVVATHLAAQQAQCGHEVGIIATESAQDEARVEALREQLPGFDQVSLFSCPNLPLKEFAGWGPGLALLKKLLDRRVFVHLHGVWDPLIKSAAHWMLRLGGAYGIAPHGMLDPWCLRQKRLKKEIALRLGVKAVLNNAAFVHVLTENEGRQVEKIARNTRVATIPNGVDLGEVDNQETLDIHDILPELGGHRYILFLGRLHHKKGLDLLMAAFRRIAEQHDAVDLVIAGADFGERSTIERNVSDRPLKRRVHLPGPLYGSRKLSVLKNAACFCLPSRSEGFSVAVVEALACRVPVVISEQCYFPEVAGAGAGIVVPLNTDALIDGLAAFLSDAEKCRSAGGAGRRLVERRYTWPVVADRAVDAYEQFGLVR